ncbi:DUF1611 domain-containing protein [Micromonospora sp. KC207]|uniref:DUF1611 domain-containing protein n=1 Tax=Micromonospora sp. KC207 TaxID=2530377 RepID=UPI00104EB1F6|nr:DUF1611 domain-containing protein [Micromonospora sp. KC207]TDC59363.1 DUF1611 domain-containing protein [Micromonospora sp. KC207]
MVTPTESMEALSSALDPVAVWTDGRLGAPGTKTASGLILTGTRWTVACVVDTRHAGADAGEVLGVGPLGVPVVPDFAAARRAGARSVVVGVNSMDANTVVPARLKTFAVDMVGHGLNVICSTHARLNDDPELVRLAVAAGVELVDVRVDGPRETLSADLSVDATVLLTTGTDCAVGKMTTALAVHREALSRGMRSAFLATGQIAAMCGADAVVQVDRIFADFITGAVQHAVHRLASAGHELVVVEGQAATLHRVYGGNAVNLLYGAAPDAIIMCHDTDRQVRAMFPGLPVPPVTDELQTVADLGRRVGIPATLAGFSVFGGKPFHEGNRYAVPVVNTRAPGGAAVLLDSVLRLTRHTERGRR